MGSARSDWTMIEVCQLFISPGHNFFGHHGQLPDHYPMIEVDQLECVAGRGLRGDRFFGYRENYKGQITFFSVEVFLALCRELNLDRAHPSQARRNVFVRTLPDLNQLVGVEFQIQGIHFAGVEECKPCYWMDTAFSPGAEQWLKGRGGLRARILTDGVLHRSSDA